MTEWGTNDSESRLKSSKPANVVKLAQYYYPSYTKSRRDRMKESSNWRCLKFWTFEKNNPDYLQGTLFIVKELKESLLDKYSTCAFPVTGLLHTSPANASERIKGSV